jgi:hypothetical protein
MELPAIYSSDLEVALNMLRFDIERVGPRLRRAQLRQLLLLLLLLMPAAPAAAFLATIGCASRPLLLLTLPAAPVSLPFAAICGLSCCLLLLLLGTAWRALRLLLLLLAWHSYGWALAIMSYGTLHIPAQSSATAILLVIYTVICTLKMLCSVKTHWFFGSTHSCGCQLKDTGSCSPSKVTLNCMGRQARHSCCLRTPQHKQPCGTLCVPALTRPGSNAATDAAIKLYNEFINL